MEDEDVNESPLSQSEEDSSEVEALLLLSLLAPVSSEVFERAEF